MNLMLRSLSREKARILQPVAGEEGSAKVWGLQPSRERSSHRLLSLEEALTCGRGSSPRAGGGYA